MPKASVAEHVGSLRELFRSGRIWFDDYFMPIQPFIPTQPQEHKPMSNFKFNLGDEVKDQVTSVSGVIVSQTLWLNGCKRYTIDRTSLKDDGSIHEGISVDEQQLVLVTALKVNVGQPLNNEKPRPFTGGPKPIPKAVGR